MRWKPTKSLLALVVVAFSIGSDRPAGAQTPSRPASTRPLSIQKLDGGSVQTDLGLGVLNKGSRLRRTWIIINDPESPLTLDSAGVLSTYGSRYGFRGTGTARATAAVSAFEITYFLYDMFGDHLTTLGGVHAQDVPVSGTVALKDVGRWSPSENEVSEYLTSVAIVSAVRKADGQVWKMDDHAVTQALVGLDLRGTDAVKVKKD